MALNARQAAIIELAHLPVWQIVEITGERYSCVWGTLHRHGFKATPDDERAKALRVERCREALQKRRDREDDGPVAIPRTHLEPETLKEARRMIGYGEPLESVAKLFNITPTRLRRHIAR